ncbi:MAG: outer membrane protein assembly factor [Schleiferiaceae bacterium]|nr:outer membrane protein assembly factor [Schleiferiaceae bacterium]
MRINSITFFFLLISISAFAQKQGPIMRTWNRVFNDTSKAAHSKFIVYPVIGYTPETRWEFGASGLYVFNAKKDPKNRLSELSAFTFLTLERQYGLYLDHAMYTDKNKYFFLGKFRLQQFPLLYYGIGVNTPSDPVARIDGFSFTWRERVLRRIRKNLYAGIELDLNHLSSVHITDVKEEFIPPPGVEGFTNFGFGLGLVYDERYNVLNPREGVFLEGGFLRYDQNIGSDYSFTNYFLDFRLYAPTFKDQLLAYQFYMNAISPFNGSEVPFNQLSLMGGESLMRGYYLGRYRDNVLMATQAEYRFLPFPFSRRFGGTLFGSLGAVSPSVPDLNLNQVRFAGGAGIRFLLFPGKDIYTRFDVAMTNEGVGYYIFIGEAF